MDPVNGLDSSLIFLGMDQAGFNSSFPAKIANISLTVTNKRSDFTTFSEEIYVS